jgi:hypothetical protein
VGTSPNNGGYPRRLFRRRAKWLEDSRLLAWVANATNDQIPADSRWKTNINEGVRPGSCGQSLNRPSVLQSTAEANRHNLSVFSVIFFNLSPHGLVRNVFHPPVRLAA